MKYKITFEGKGKVLVSGHHLAFDRMPKVEELSIGSRVVVKSPSDATEYQPAIMAELPSRKNRMRFECLAERRNFILNPITSLYSKQSLLNLNESII